MVTEQEKLTPTGSYPVQIFAGKVSISTMSGQVQFDLEKLLKSLRECGYQIIDPLSKGFLEIYEYLNSSEDMEQLDCIGGTIYKYHSKSRNKLVTIAAGSAKVELNIDNKDGLVFVGHVISLEEFKLIWDRVL